MTRNQWQLINDKRKMIATDFCYGLLQIAFDINADEREREKKTNQSYNSNAKKNAKRMEGFLSKSSEHRNKLQIRCQKTIKTGAATT